MEAHTIGQALCRPKGTDRTRNHCSCKHNDQEQPFPLKLCQKQCASFCGQRGQSQGEAMACRVSSLGFQSSATSVSHHLRQTHRHQMSSNPALLDFLVISKLSKCRDELLEGYERNWWRKLSLTCRATEGLSFKVSWILLLNKCKLKDPFRKTPKCRPSCNYGTRSTH